MYQWSFLSWEGGSGETEKNIANTVKMLGLQQAVLIPQPLCGRGGSQAL